VRRTAVQCVSVLSAAGFLLAPAGMPRGKPTNPLAVAMMRMWVEQNEGERCRGQDRKNLRDRLMGFDSTLSKKSADKQVTEIIGQLRPTQQVSTRGPAGMQGAHTAEEVNKKYRARKPAPARPRKPRKPKPPRPARPPANTRADLHEHLKGLGRGEELLATPKLIDELTSDILNKLRDELGGLSIRGIALNHDCSFYFGYTSVKAVVEAYMFMGRSRPVVRRWSAKTGTTRMHFTPKDCREELGMKHVVVYESDIKFNAYEVESALQQALHNLPLGRRLWRIVGMGHKEPNTFPDDTRHKVFVTYTFKVQPGIKDNTIILQE
jgi:hypothetical protein